MNRNRIRTWIIAAILLTVLAIISRVPKWLQVPPTQPAYAGVEFTFTAKRGGQCQHEVIYPRDSFTGYFHGQAWEGSLEFVGRSRHGDVYVLDLAPPGGSHLVNTVLYVGKPVTVCDTVDARVVLRPLANK